MKKLILIFLLISLFGCAEKDINTDKIQMIVSLIPLQDFAQQVGDDKVNVTVMVPPGASPHSYEPTPSQLKSVSNADMYIKVGTPVEFEIVWLDKIINMNKEMVVIDSSNGIDLILNKDIDEHSHDIDPHIWTSPRNAIIMVENIHNSLIKLDPDNSDYYDKRKNDYVKELSALDKEIKQAIKKENKFIVYHPAWGYLAHDYGLEQIPVEQEGKKPSAKSISNIIRLAKEENIKVIFASPQFSTESAKMIANEINGEVMLIDPLAKNYIHNMQKIVNAFAKVMK